MLLTLPTEVINIAFVYSLLSTETPNHLIACLYEMTNAFFVAKCFNRLSSHLQIEEGNSPNNLNAGLS